VVWRSGNSSDRFITVHRILGVEIDKKIAKEFEKNDDLIITMIRHKILKFKTEEYLEFRDLTEEIERFLKESGIKEGQVLVFSKHTTVAVCINEKEKGIVKDFKNLLKKILPKDGYYCHNDLKIRTENLVCQSGESDCLNGHSHCTQLMMRNSEAIPVIDGKMTLGVWQRIFAIELDCCREREIVVQIMGE